MRFFKEELGSTEKLIDFLAESLKPETGEKIRANADLIRESLAHYEEDNPVLLTMKARRLTYARERLLSYAEIITDARPVFDSIGENIHEFVVTHSLVITSQVGNESRKEYYSIDNADLLNIRKACDRAFIKARTLKSALEEKWPTKVLKDNDSRS